MPAGSRSAEKSHAVPPTTRGPGSVANAARWAPSSSAYTARDDGPSAASFFATSSRGTPAPSTTARSRFSTTAWDCATTPTRHPCATSRATTRAPTYVLPVPGGPCTARYESSRRSTAAVTASTTSSSARGSAPPAALSASTPSAARAAAPSAAWAAAGGTRQGDRRRSTSVAASCGSEPVARHVARVRRAASSVAASKRLRAGPGRRGERDRGRVERLRARRELLAHDEHVALARRRRAAPDVEDRPAAEPARTPSTAVRAHGGKGGS